MCILVCDLEVKAKRKARSVRKSFMQSYQRGKSYYVSFDLSSCYFGSFTSGHELSTYPLVCAIRKEYTPFSPIQ